MNLKYNIGDTVYVPAVVRKITVESKCPTYEVRIYGQIFGNIRETDLRPGDDCYGMKFESEGTKNE